MATRIQKETKTTEGPGGSSIKTTSYQSSSSYDTEGILYRPGITPRSLVINRSVASPAKSGYSVERSSMSYGGMGVGAPAGAYQAVTSLGTANIKTSRTREKKDMQDLNERFASYIERVRFLEAQNRKLADELDKLKSKWGKETTAIKAMYEAELNEARNLLNEAEKEKGRLQIRNASVEEELDELKARLAELKNALTQEKERVEQQNGQLSQYESEINMLNRRNEGMENAAARDKKDIARLQEALNRARIDLDNETLNHIDAENRRQTLEEEIEFLKQVHDQEMKELAALAYRDTTSENREFWKSELANAIREIQSSYDEKMDLMKGEMDTFYNMKVQEFRTGAAKNNMETVHAKEEVKRLRSQVGDLRGKLQQAEADRDRFDMELRRLREEYEERIRQLELEKCEFSDLCNKRSAELEAVLKELQEIMDFKLGLELEIAAYRKLLEGEENNLGLRQVVESIIEQQGVRNERAAESRSMYTVRQTEQTTGDSNLKVSQVVKGEMSAKTTYQRSAKGPVSISETDGQGRFVTIENTGRREEVLKDWTIKRNIDGHEKSSYKFSDETIRPGSKIKIYASGFKHEAGPNDLIASFQSWGIGANITTKICNPGNEERATHVQKTVYTS